MKLYCNESSDPKTNAQRNLIGRTHYVDDDTLRFHKSRVLSARAVDNGLLFAIATSDALDYENNKRGFRYVIFDVFGHVVSRVELNDAFKSHAAAIKAMWQWLNGFDAKAHTLEAIAKARLAYIAEMQELRALVQQKTAA